MCFHTLTERIESADVITVFRHAHPDCDALGSQNAMKTWIQNRYPQKQVYALGYETSSQGEFPASDTVSDEVIRNSLAIVLDTSNKERIDDARWQTAKDIVKVDHHPDFDRYASFQIVKPDYAAVCEILTEYFMEEGPEDVSLLTAEYLYMGLLTDTLCFRTNNTTSHTLQMASWLAGREIDIPFINRCLFDQSYTEYRFDTFLRENAVIVNRRLAYAVVTKEQADAWQIRPADARNHIDTFGHVKEFQVWAIFTERSDEPGVYDGSLRSKEIAVNDIARQYRGGGHRNAAGVKGLSEEEISKLIKELDEALSH